MFNIGDKVVYPMHGAGIIEEIEEKQILDSMRKYYIMRIPFGDMKVMIPIDNIEEIGVRGIVSKEVLLKVMSLLGDAVSVMSDNWNRRYRENMEKLRSGDIFQVAEVVRNLMMAEKEKGLSTGERKMLLNAKQILISEIVLINGMDIAEAGEFVVSAVFATA